jgi:phosphate butyryltransferase
MQIKNFDDVIQQIKNIKTPKIAVAVAEDEEILRAVRQIQDKGLAEAILTGDENKIKEISSKHSISLDGFEVIHEPDHAAAAQKCCEIIREGKASVLVKGLLDSSKFMRAALNKQTGLNSGNLISHLAMLELETYPKLLFLTDAGVNTSPTLDQKATIINNSVKVAHSLGIEKPLVACVAAIEKVNPSAMPATVDAALLSKMNDRGQIKGCIVDGPLGFDNAISEESAKIKKITGEVAGKADIILCNDIHGANYLYKAFVFLAKAKAAAIVTGANAPIVMTSRADSHETKYLSIALAILSTKEN